MDAKEVSRIERVVKATTVTFLRTWPGRCIGHQSCDDLCQEIFLKLIDNDGRELDKYDPDKGSLEGFVRMKAMFYLLTIARKQTDRGRLAPTEPIEERDFETVQDAADHLADVHKRLLAIIACVEGAVSEPTDVPRVAPILLKLQGDDELERQLDVPKSRLQRLRNKLREHAKACWQKLFPGEDLDGYMGRVAKKKAAQVVDRTESHD